MVREAYVQDMPKISLLMQEWGLGAHHINYVSDIGFVVPDGDKINGAAFLYTTNSPMAHMEAFVVNRKIPKKMRSSVIDALILKVIDAAKSMGFKCLIAEPSFDRSQSRLLEHGFRESGVRKFLMEF